MVHIPGMVLICGKKKQINYKIMSAIVKGDFWENHTKAEVQEYIESRFDDFDDTATLEEIDALFTINTSEIHWWGSNI